VIVRNAAPVNENEVRAFEPDLAGELIAPGDARYDAARRVWNGMVDRRPALIVRCAGERDVVAALRLAREHGLPVAVRCGGHNVAGNAVCDGGVVIDLSTQKRISVDPATRIARARPGVLLGELDQVLAGAVVHAFAPEVFRFFADFAAEAPDELSVTASTFRASPAMPVPRELHGSS
jgi:FAD/FMN-containing dehydrogenase